LRLSVPESEESFVESLANIGILTQDIDDLMAHKILTEHMEDFYEFIESIEQFLEKNAEQSDQQDL